MQLFRTKLLPKSLFSPDYENSRSDSTSAGKLEGAVTGFVHPLARLPHTRTRKGQQSAHSGDTCPNDQRRSLAPPPALRTPFRCVWASVDIPNIHELSGLTRIRSADHIFE